MYTEPRFRPAYAFAQTDKNIHWAHFGKPRTKVSSWENEDSGPTAQADLSLFGEHILEDSLAHVATHLTKFRMSSATSLLRAFIVFIVYIFIQIELFTKNG